MKKFLLAMCVAFVAIACTVDDTTPIQPDSLGNDVPTIIHASVDAQMRSELQWEDDAPKSYWSVGDKIAVFNALPNYNAYELDSDEPCHDGDFKLIEGSEIKGAEDGFEFAETVAFYPYADNLTLQSGENESAVLKFVVPATQLFVESDSYCETSNPMVAVEMDGDYSFKNLFGFLKITLKGSETIKKITLKGNNGEILAGDCEANIADYSVAVGDNGSTELTIDCGEGVGLNEEGISFIFALPPTIFEQGFTIEATDTEYRCFTISTTNEVAITRNAIQPMNAIASSEAAVSCIIDAEAMTAEQLNAAVVKALDYGITDISVNLAEDADEAMFSAIAAALATTVDPSLDEYELVMNYSGTIDLTISGAKTIPECIFCVDEYANENWRAGAALRSVTLTDATTIGEGTFYGCAMTSFSAPKVISIEGYAFNPCMNLTDVYLPSVQTLGVGVFFECYALKTISLPECIDLGNGVFNSCEALETVYAPKATNLGAIEFMLCTSLTKVTLGSVQSVNQIYGSIDSGLFCLANDTQNIELVLSSEQKVMTFDRGTKYWTATETDYNGSVDHNNKSFIGYTFKSVTFH